MGASNASILSVTGALSMMKTKTIQSWRVAGMKAKGNQHFGENQKEISLTKT